MTTFSRRQVLCSAASVAFVGAAPLFSAEAKQPTQVAFRRGVNAWPWFSLTREYPAPRTDYGEPPFQTGRPVPTASDLRVLYASGLDFVRIPVDPGPFLAGDRKQKGALLDSLMGAVDTALGVGLHVIVNVQANGATHYWNPERMISSVDAPAFQQYRILVGEIAQRLDQFSLNGVVLEPVNEPPQACGSPVWLDIQDRLLGSARSANPSLPLVATGSCGSMVPGLTALDPARLQSYEPLFFTFHFYEPYLFSHQGAPWMREPVYRSLNNVPWPASAGSLEATLAAVRDRMARDRETPEAARRAAYAETERVLKDYFNANVDRPFIDHYLGMCRDWADSHGITPDRIIMGEFGALRSDDRYVAAPPGDRARYVRDVRLSAEKFGFPWAFWNLFDGMGMMDDTTRALDPAIIDALGLSMPAN